jgi:hypothetical protein
MAEVTIPHAEQVRVANLPFKLPLRLCEIINGFKWAMHSKKQSAVMIIDGRSGMGKTTLSSQVGLYIDPDFNLENIYFTPDKFLEGLSKAKKGETLVFDEAMLLSSRAALSQINRMIVIAMSMIRSKNLLIIFNVNSVFDLDRNLALSRADLLLHCYGDSLTDKGKFLAFFKGGDGQDRIKQLYIYGKKYYSYSHPKSNFNARFSSFFTVDDDEYEAKKQIGVTAFLTGSKTQVAKKDKDARDRYIRYLYKNTDLTQEMIAELGDIGSKTVWNSLHREEKPENKFLR